MNTCRNTLKRHCFLPVFTFLYVFFFITHPYGKGGNRMIVTSPAFNEGGMIPKQYTCDSIDISPPLKWLDVPQGTLSFALICDDPDAPMGTWVHWVAFNLPADTTSLPENILPEENMQNGMKQGRNDFRKIGYGGPCPPGGTHRYFFKVYALSEVLTVKAGITKAELLKAMEGKILAEGQLMGKYKR
jgi:Raf kinase inhibitor-like YbhB/YbcL family protein